MEPVRDSAYTRARAARMNSEISWHVELRIKAGHLDNFRLLTEEMVAFTRHEPGALSYQRFISADDVTIHVYERYINSAAALSHLQAFSRTYSERFSGMVERTRFVVFWLPERRA
jgi:quinol monooxygenase YgiN